MSEAELYEQLLNESDPQKIVELVEQINRVEYSRVCERCEEQIAVAFSGYSGAAVCAECQISEAEAETEQCRKQLTNILKI